MKKQPRLPLPKAGAPKRPQPKQVAVAPAAAPPAWAGTPADRLRPYLPTVLRENVPASRAAPISPANLPAGAQRWVNIGPAQSQQKPWWTFFTQGIPDTARAMVRRAGEIAQETSRERERERLQHAWWTEHAEEMLETGPQDWRRAAGERTAQRERLMEQFRTWAQFRQLGEQRGLSVAQIVRLAHGLGIRPMTARDVFYAPVPWWWPSPGEGVAAIRG